MYEQFDPNQLAQMRQLEEMKRNIMSKILTKEASERLGRVRSVNPELAGQVELYLLQIYQTGKLQGTKIDDGKMKEILRTLTEKKDYSIKRR